MEEVYQYNGSLTFNSPIPAVDVLGEITVAPFFIEKKSASTFLLNSDVIPAV